MAPVSPVEPNILRRFWQKVQVAPPCDCWLWTGATFQGYGRMYVNNTSRSYLPHRFAYRVFVGPIPAGLDIDHLCGNRCCVNPRHLEAVSHAENMRRAHERHTHCWRGHGLSGDNVYLSPGSFRRTCKQCHAIRERERRARIRNAALGVLVREAFGPEVTL